MAMERTYDSAQAERIRQSIARAKPWFAETLVAEMQSDSADLGDLSRLLLGGWLCESALQGTAAREGLASVTEHMERRLRRETLEGTFDPFRYDTKLLLITHKILSLYGYRAYGIDEFAQQVARAFKQLPGLPPRYVGELLLLAQLGYADDPPAPALNASQSGSNVLRLLFAGDAEIRDVCQNIAAASHFGRRCPQAPADVRGCLDRVLPIVLLQSIKEYNLDLGAILIRSIHFLQPNADRATTVAVDFLLDQQLPDGRFGRFAVELAQIAKTNGCDVRHASRRIHLPITVSSIWALAEIYGFNLFSFQSSPGVQAGPSGLSVQVAEPA
jgi:hypothetical protein